MVKFTGYTVNGKLQKDPPPEFVRKVKNAFTEVLGVKFIPKNSKDKG